MKSLSCPKCGAPLQAGEQACPYCGVGLVDDTPLPSGAAPVPPPSQIPEGWVRYQDSWHGFSLAYPPGWRVETTQGQISIREDPAGMVQALIWPYRLPAPLSAHQAACQFVALARAFNPTFQAWQQENAAPDSPRVTLRTQQARYGQPVVGCLNVLVEGLNAVISGYEAPAQVIGQRGPVMSAILATFRPGELMPRQPYREPMEGSFTGWVPAGWVFQAGVNRNHPSGTGMPFFSAARDPQGCVSAGMPWYSWTFTDSGGFGGFFNLPGSAPAMPFAPSVQFCQSNIAPWMAQAQAGFRVEAITDRPDLADQAYLELARAGYPPELYEATAAIIETTYTENGERMQQKSRVRTQRQRPGMGAMMGGAQLWSAMLDMQYRAPENEFTAWEPVLQGILDDIHMDEGWKAAQRQRMQAIGMQSEMDRQRRLQQISQTLRETSDMITNSYWNRQAAYDHISEVRADAIRGVHNESSPTGEVFKLPNGFDRYWMDGLGNFYGGGWMTEPDIHWIPLEPNPTY